MSRAVRRRPGPIGAIVLLLLSLVAAGGRVAAADAFVVSFDAALRAEPATGRVVLFFITETGRRWRRAEPVEGPFFSAPQPIASVAVRDWAPGEPLVLPPVEAAFPGPIERLDGRVRVQAILDVDATERSRLDGPGNLVSGVVEVDLHGNADDRVELRLVRRIEGPRELPETDNLKWVRIRSEALSAFHGRDVMLRCGVALPPDWEAARDAGRTYPTIYVIPGYGGRDDEARWYAEMLKAPDIGSMAPLAAYVVLDPESPLGHHGFADGPNNGPVGAALVRELLPHLERTFPLASRPEARIVTGHSSGGWSSLWLALQWPDTFGACWSSAPDPVDFTAFQMTDLYADASMYHMADGTPTPSYREVVTAEGETAVKMTVEQEAAMERAIDPLGASGEQWDGWEAMFSPRDPETRLPQPLFDARTGTIDRAVVESWRRYDIAAQAAARWDAWGPLFRDRIRLNVGTLDNFYLDRAVGRLKALVDARLADSPQRTGYIRIVPDETHGTIIGAITQRVNGEMLAHLRAHGLLP